MSKQINGKCFRCGKKIRDGFTLCPECADKTRRAVLEIAIKNFADDHVLSMQDLYQVIGEIVDREGTGE